MDNQFVTWQYQNKLLSLLSEREFRLLSPFLEPHEVRPKEVVVHQGEEISHIEFPCTSVYSSVLTMANGDTVEIGTIGSEGFTGVNTLFSGHAATTTIFCQIPGLTLRMGIDQFLSEMRHNPRFHFILELYCQAFISQMEKSIACNKLHALEQRAARWLLMTHDRVGADEFLLTQEFLATMLGAQRPSVSVIAQKFSDRGILTYTRGRIKILQRHLLEELSCECYSKSRQEFERLLGVRTG
ncbi:MAG TPA: Crp/Fnr family transcriptional regulator [Noviherbaspirillum sp.]